MHIEFGEEIHEHNNYGADDEIILGRYVGTQCVYSYVRTVLNPLTHSYKVTSKKELSDFSEMDYVFHPLNKKFLVVAAVAAAAAAVVILQQLHERCTMLFTPT